MKNSVTQNPIRINQVGFMTDSPKRFILTDNQTSEDTFAVYHFHETDAPPKMVFEGKLELEDERLGLYSGDFTEVNEPGDYFITAGGYQSRYFWIFDKAYDNLARILLSYFTFQRCGSELGWAGKCHTDDGIIKETGERVDLSGGYHQSGDLRKSPAGVSIGVLGMLRYGLKDTSPWGKTLFYDEIAWACDYYVKTIQDNGAMYNTLNVPFGWVAREFYKSAAPSSAQWCVTSILALGSVYFKNKDNAKAEKYLETAFRSFSYMISDERSPEQYDHPDKTPRGMDTPSFYSLCKKGNSADMAYMAVVANDLYKATGNEDFKQYVRLGADKIISLMGKDAVAAGVLLDDEDTHLAFMYNNYSHSNGGFMALCCAYEMFGDKKYLDSIRNVAISLCNIAKKNPWHLAKSIYSDEDLNMIVGHPAPGRKMFTRRDSLGELEYVGTIRKNSKEVACYYAVHKDNERVSANMSSTIGVFLKRAAKLLDDKDINSVAQSQIDAVLGANFFDASHVNGVGLNHINHRPYAQFFPPVPHIPGAINIGFTSISHAEYSEYDMPCVGMFMYLLSECL